MSSDLRFLCHEHDEDGHLVEVYEDGDGNIKRVTIFPTVEFIQHQTQVLEATEHLLIQRARVVLADAELQAAREYAAACRSRSLQIGNTTDLRRLPIPKQGGG